MLEAVREPSGDSKEAPQYFAVRGLRVVPGESVISKALIVRPVEQVVGGRILFPGIPDRSVEEPARTDRRVSRCQMSFFRNSNGNQAHLGARPPHCNRIIALQPRAAGLVQSGHSDTLLVTGEAKK